MDVSEFTTRQRKLLELERTEEQLQRQEKIADANFKIFQKLQSRGDAILGLHAERPTESQTSLEGHSLLILSRRSTFLPSHRFTTGDNVSIRNLHSQNTNKSKDSNTSSIGGVIYKVSKESIVIATETIPSEDELDFKLFSCNTLVMIKLADDVTYHRLTRALDKIDQHQNLAGKEIHAHNTRMIEVLFHAKKPQRNQAQSDEIRKETIFHNQNLNNSQKEAIQFCLESSDIALIHGPPGTGKTTTVVEFILQCVDRGLKVLACAPSNVAVDNLVLGLLPYIIVDKKKVPKPKIIRAGHPARMLPDVLQYSLEHVLQYTSGTEVVREVLDDINEKNKAFARAKSKHARSAIQKDLRSLRKELITRQRKAVKELLLSVDVLLTTNTGCDSKYLGLHKLADEIKGFDVIIIDEAAQSLEVSCWIPILLGKKVVLAGDHLQLPPTILSNSACGKQPDGGSGLDETLFDRLIRNDESIAKMLTVQYRMNCNIMKWSSDALYDGKIIAGESVSSHLLCDLPNITKTPLTSVPLCMIDTCGEMNEQKYDENDSSNQSGAFIELESKWNEGEAVIVKNLVDELIHNGLSTSDIGVITPYNAQVETLRSVITHPDIEIGSVDGFQGREKEAILISMVRSNEDGEIGFLSERRRMNVAITRARRLVVVVCDSTTIYRDEFLNDMLEYFQSNKNSLYLTNRDYQIQLKHTIEEIEEEKALLRERAAAALAKANFQLEESKKKQEELKKEKEKKRKEIDDTESSARQELDIIIKNFLDGNDESVKFPSSLSSGQRKYVHETCESLGLLHITKQEGSDRFITISKPKSIKEEEEEVKEEKEEREDKEEEIVVEQKIEEPEIEGEKEIPTNSSGSKKKNKKKNKNKQPNKPVNSGGNTKQEVKLVETPAPFISGKKARRKEGETIDSVMAELNIKEPNMCYFGTCRRPTNILTDPCKYCNAKYCQLHDMAERHGCGDKAREQARGTWIAQNSSHRPLSETEREKARTEVKKKINASKAKRKGKGKKGKKK